MTVLATVIDPGGVPVDLTDTQWQHICEQRPALAGLRDDILRAGHTQLATTSRYLHARPASERAAQFTAAFGKSSVRDPHDEPATL